MRPSAAVLACAALLAAPVPCPAAETIPPAPRDLRELDHRLAAAFQAAGIPGAEVAIVEHGEVVLLEGYGFADVARRIPATPDTPFRAGSISKSFTSLGVMTLVEQGRLSLDARLADLAPEVRFANRWEAEHPVRLVHLLEHTTGWPNISLRTLTASGPGWTTLRGVQAASRDFVCRWPPGRFALYNDAGPAVAGYLMEKASGERFESYMRDRVLRPMGMPTADFDLTPGLAARLAKSYELDGAVTPYQEIILRPAGSLNASVRELAQLVKLYLGRGTVDGRRILGPESVDRIERSESNLASRDGFTTGYGLGNAPFPDGGIVFRGHNGSIDAFTAVYGYLARNRSGYVLMANGGRGVNFGTPISQLIERYLTRDLAPSPPPAVRVAAGELARDAGWYVNITPPNALIRPYTDALGLVHVSAGASGLRERGHDLVPVAARVFRRSDREIPTLAFVPEGGATYRLTPFNATEKLPSWAGPALAALGAALLLGLLGSAVAAIVGLALGARGSLHDRGGWPVHALPLLAYVALIVTFVLPLLSIAGSGMEPTWRLARPCGYSLTVLACSVLFPALAVAGWVCAARARWAHPIVRGSALLACTALLVVAAYAGSIGWIGIRTWTL